MPRRITIILLALFFFYHTAAVGFSSIGQTLKDPLSKQIFSLTRPYFRSYLRLAFNQKQSWRMFSSPGRKVVFFGIEKQVRRKKWEEIARIDFDYFPWRNRSHNLKLTRNYARDKGNRKKLRAAYLKTFCERLDLPSEDRAETTNSYLHYPEEKGRTD